MQKVEKFKGYKRFAHMGSMATDRGCSLSVVALKNANFRAKQYSMKRRGIKLGRKRKSINGKGKQKFFDVREWMARETRLRDTRLCVLQSLRIYRCLCHWEFESQFTSACLVKHKKNTLYLKIFEKVIYFKRFFKGNFFISRLS